MEPYRILKINEKYLYNSDLCNSIIITLKLPHRYLSCITPPILTAIPGIWRHLKKSFKNILKLFLIICIFWRKKIDQIHHYQIHEQFALIINLKPDLRSKQKRGQVGFKIFIMSSFFNNQSVWNVYNVTFPMCSNGRSFWSDNEIIIFIVFWVFYCLLGSNNPKQAINCWYLSFSYLQNMVDLIKNPDDK